VSDELSFVDERAPAEAPARPWLVLIVDDEEEVHAVTELALRDCSFAGRPLAFLHAYSAGEGCRMLKKHRQIALVLLDVVMESDRAGLEVVQYAREVLKNPFVRIVLRTGQPGQAPEVEVITRYDINDYKQKTELTRERLFTTVYTSLSVYRDLRALDANRRGLEKVIEASAHIFELRSIEQFTQGVLEQLTALLYLDRDAVMVRASGLAARPQTARLRIVAATGAYADLIGRDAGEALPPEVQARMEAAREGARPVFGPGYFAGYYPGVEELVFYVAADAPLDVSDRRLIEMFCRNVVIARDNLRLFGPPPGEAP
jgi:CheY-like chemotaxis protein